MCTCGSCPAPCQVHTQWSSLSCEAPVYSQVQGDTRRTTVVVSRSPTLVSAPAISTAASRLQGPGCSMGRGAPICTAQGHLVAGAFSLFCVFPASAFPGVTAGSWGVSPSTQGSGACSTGIALLGPRSTLPLDPLPELPKLLLGPCWVHAPGL